MSTTATTNQIDITQRTDSGYYQTYQGTKAQGWPEDTNNWQHLLSSTHSEPSNYYSLQIAGSFFDNENFYIRKTADNGNQIWRKLYHDNNFGLLGKNIGINWRPYEARILVDKTHDVHAQGILDVQISTRPGTLASPGAVGNGVSFMTRALPDTKYGHFNAITLLENYSTYNQQNGDNFFGHVSLAPYINQHNINATPAWAIAAEVKEVHGQANPQHGSLAAELTVIATGSDANNKRTMLFLPTNILNGNESQFTEFSHGIFWKTASNTKYKNAMYLEGQFDCILNASEVNGGRLIQATGEFSYPAIDLHAVRNITGGAAIAINQAHSVQFQNAAGVTLGGMGYDQDTLQIAGVRMQGSVGGSAGYVVLNVNGTRYGMPIFNLQ